jgi:hypothetical protein
MDQKQRGEDNDTSNLNKNTYDVINVIDNKRVFLIDRDRTIV